MTTRKLSCWAIKLKDGSLYDGGYTPQVYRTQRDARNTMKLVGFKGCVIRVTLAWLA